MFQQVHRLAESRKWRASLKSASWFSRADNKGFRSATWTALQFDGPARLEGLSHLRQADGWRPFTDRFLVALNPRSRSYHVLDLSRKGLLLRVTPNGVKTFYFRDQQNLQVTRLMRF